MVTVFDKYIVQEGFNGVFSYVGNSEIVSRPSREGFESANFFVCKRDGLVTPNFVYQNRNRVVNGDIIAGRVFSTKEYFYTTNGYVYSFDGTKLAVQNINPVFINNSTENNLININATSDLSYAGQEFDVTTSFVLNNVKLRIKKNTGSTNSGYLVGYITLASDKTTPIAKSYNIIQSSDITDAYSIQTFDFGALTLNASTKYFLYVEGVNTSTASQIHVSHNTTNVYGGTGSQSFSGNNAMTWTALGGDLWFEVGGSGPATLDTTNYDESIINVNYISAERHPSAVFNTGVSSYNPTTLTITTVSTALNSTYIGKYVYITSGKGQYQARNIVDVPANNQLVISNDFNVLPDATSLLIFFTEITDQLRFTQIRQGSSAPQSNFCLSIDEDGLVKWIYMPERRQLQFRDNRVVQLTKDNAALLYSSNIDYEIPILQKTEFGNSKALSFGVYGPYLIVYFKNKIGLIKKDIIDAEAGTFAYLYQDILDLGVYSTYSYLVSKGQLIIQQNDGQLYTIDLSTVSFGEIQAKPIPLSVDISSELNSLVGGDTRIYYDNSQIRLVRRGPEGVTRVFKYYEVYKGWIIDEYDFSGNFYQFFYRLGKKTFVCKGNKVFTMGGLKDDGLNYTQRIKMYGPVEAEYTTTTPLVGIIKMGFDGINKVGGSGLIRIGGSSLYTSSYDFSKLKVCNKINTEIEKNGSFGTNLFGEKNIGGDAGGKDLLKILPEIFFSSFGVYKKGQHYTIEIENSEEKQLYFGGISVINKSESGLATPNKSRA